MKRAVLFFQLLAIGLCIAQDTIDWDKARELHQRSQKGGALTEAEQAYLDKARELRRNRAARPEGDNSRRPGGGAQRPAPETLTPLTDPGAEADYEGQDGGLYGAGLNQPPAGHRKAAEAQLAKIQPLDAQGKPSEDGKIVFISISMSNATQEFSTFKQLADRSETKSANTVVVDCAQGGQTIAQWAPPEARPWQVAVQRLKSAGVTPDQVQVAWVRLANKMPRGSLDEHGKILAGDTIRVLQNAKAEFPNLRIA